MTAPPLRKNRLKGVVKRVFGLTLNPKVFCPLLVFLVFILLWEAVCYHLEIALGAKDN